MLLILRVKSISLQGQKRLSIYDLSLILVLMLNIQTTILCWYYWYYAILLTHCICRTDQSKAKRPESHFNLLIILADKILQAHREQDDRTGPVLACHDKVWFQSNLRFKDISGCAELFDVTEYILAVKTSQCHDRA